LRRYKTKDCTAYSLNIAVLAAAHTAYPCVVNTHALA